MRVSEFQKTRRFNHASTDHRVDFFGMPVVDRSIEDVVAQLERHLIHRESTHVVNLNPYHFLLSRDDREFETICATGDVVFADGVGIKFASALQNRHIHHRYTGLDVMLELCTLSAVKGYSVFLFGGQHGIVDDCAAQLRKQLPGLTIAGTFEPPFVEGIEEFDNETIIRTINRSQPDLLFVALGAPKQEKWIERYRDRLDVPIMMGVGGSFDILGGRFSRAPHWMRSLGLEWLYRLLSEPTRLSGRYLLGIPLFVYLILRLKFGSSRNVFTR